MSWLWPVVVSEAADADGDQPGSLSQEDFESFFHQIRRFLTVQEQIDLFSRWFEGGAADAGFLTVLALTAAGVLAAQA